MSMTKREIIEHAFGDNGVYSTDPSRRGLNTSQTACVYTGVRDDGKIVRCAVGQWVRPEILDEWDLDTCDPSGSSVDEVLTHLQDHGVLVELDDMLLPEVHGHHISFWENMQTMHDGSENFDDHGLSEEGVTALADLRYQYRD